MGISPMIASLAHGKGSGVMWGYYYITLCSLSLKGYGFFLEAPTNLVPKEG